MFFKIRLLKNFELRNFSFQKGLPDQPKTFHKNTCCLAIKGPTSGEADGRCYLDHCISERNSVRTKTKSNTKLLHKMSENFQFWVFKFFFLISRNYTNPTVGQLEIMEAQISFFYWAKSHGRTHYGQPSKLIFCLAFLLKNLYVHPCRNTKCI